MPTCKGCGKKIIFGQTESGKVVPLDPAPPVFEVWQKAPDGTTFVKRNLSAFVSHFATCPRANDFSGSKKKKTGELYDSKED